jgi:hypothetical protein
MNTPKDHIESGAGAGRRQAFAVIAGKCSTAQAAALQEIKQSRVYESLGLTWQEYCPRYAGMTRERADLLIRQFDEFGEYWSPRCQRRGLRSAFRQLDDHRL